MRSAQPGGASPKPSEFPPHSWDKFYTGQRRQKIPAKMAPASLTAKCFPMNLGTPLCLGHPGITFPTPVSKQWDPEPVCMKQNGKEKKNVFRPLHWQVLLPVLSEKFTAANISLGFLWSSQLQSQHAQSRAAYCCQQWPLDWGIFLQPRHGAE